MTSPREHGYSYTDLKPPGWGRRLLEMPGRMKAQTGLEAYCRGCLEGLEDVYCKLYWLLPRTATKLVVVAWGKFTNVLNLFRTFLTRRSGAAPWPSRTKG